MIWNDKNGELAVFAVNRDEKQKREVEVNVYEFELKKIIQSISMTAEDKKMTNQDNHQAVIPKEADNVKIEENKCNIWLEPLSFNMVRIKV